MSILPTLFISFVVYLFSFQSVSANVLFEDDFNFPNPSKWTVARNGCVGDEWEFKNGMLGIKIDYPNSCVTEIIPSNEVWNPDWNDYQIDIDMKHVSGYDRNFAWRFTEPLRWLGIHFQGTNLGLQRMTTLSEENIQPFPNGNTYHIRVRSEGYLHEISLYNILTPDLVTKYHAIREFPIYALGRPALQASVGSSLGSEVWFDNIVVTSIDKKLDVPYFAQNDPEWGDEVYDHLGPLTKIKDVGCAMTSAAMIMAYHNITQFFGLSADTLGNVADGVGIDPDTLNNVLTNRIAGYAPNGNVYFPDIAAITGLISNAVNNHDEVEDPNEVKLEYLKEVTDDYTELDSIYDDKDPKIIEVDETLSPSGVHFLVAKGTKVSGEEYFVNDPLSTDEVLETENHDLVSVRTFTKTNSDFSYLTVFSSEELAAVVENEGVRLGTLADGSQVSEFGRGWVDKSYPIANDTNPTETAGEVLNEASLPKPESGQYLVKIVNLGDAGVKKFQVYLHSKYGQGDVLEFEVFMGEDEEIAYWIDYDKEDLSQTSVIFGSASFDRLREVIRYLYETGDLKLAKNRDQLLRIVDLSERLTGVNTIAACNVFETLQKFGAHYMIKNQLSDAGFSLLDAEIALFSEHMGW